MGAHGFRFSFTPRSGVLFTFPSRYWFAIGRRLVFSLGGWALRIQAGFHVSRPTWGDGGDGSALRRRGFHPLWRRFPAASARASLPVSRPRNPGGQARRFGLGPLSLAATHGIAFCFLFLRLLRCFTSPGSRLADHGFVRRHRPKTVGCPIRRPPDRRPHASPRGFSQLAASFIACRRQGIRRAPVQPGRHKGARPALRAARRPKAPPA